jgi:hypothetical protein
METAKAKEPASLPRQPAGAAMAAPAQRYEQSAAAQEVAERQALLKSSLK